MRLNHFSLFAVIGSAALLVCASFGRVATAAIRTLERFAALVIDTLARPVSVVTAGAPVSFAGGVPSRYDAPSLHSLRHEAGTSRRAAPRNT